MRQKQVEYGRTDGEEEEKASRRISHQRGGKGSSGDGDVQAKKVRKNPGIVRENDSSDSSDFDPPRSILVDKGKARKSSPLFDESGLESGDSDVQIVENSVAGMLSNPSYTPRTHLTSTETQQSVRHSKRPSSPIDERGVEADRGKGTGVKRQKGTSVQHSPSGHC